MKHLVEITETLQRIVEVDAGNDDDAENIVREQYRVCEIILDESDLKDVSFRVVFHAGENNGELW